MVYHNKVAVAIKCGGRVLREIDNKVSLPFGSEYSVLIKNTDSVRIMAKVSIDGKDVCKTGGGWLIIAPNSSLDLERYINDLNEGNRFKFIERTQAVENHRGIQVDDGLVRVEFKTEKRKPIPIPAPYYEPYYYPYYPVRTILPWTPPYTPCKPWTEPYVWGTLQGGGTGVGAVQTSGGQQVSSSGAGLVAFNSVSNYASTAPAEGVLRSRAMQCNTAGITAPGSKSHQQFVLSNNFDTVPGSEVIVLHLVGEVGGKPVAKPVTVKTLKSCGSCGRSCKSSMQFCPDCGTALQVV